MEARIFLQLGGDRDVHAGSSPAETGVAAFEGPFGLFGLFKEGRPEEVLDGLGRRYLIDDTALKRFPACGCSHAALAATLEIVAATASPARM